MYVGFIKKNIFKKLTKNEELTPSAETIQDITEKKKLEKEIEYKQEEINKLQKRFQILIQESDDVFEIIDPDGTIRYISEATERVIEYKVEERVGRSEEHTSELQSRPHLVCRLLLE